MVYGPENITGPSHGKDWVKDSVSPLRHFTVSRPCTRQILEFPSTHP